METILDVGVAEGMLPAGLVVATAANLLIGPLIFASIAAPEGSLNERVLADLADHVVDRFIASSRG